MNIRMEASWKAHLAEEFEKPYFVQLTDAVRKEYSQTVCYPPARLVFNAFDLCPFDKVKVVIIGQDPYHEPGQAHGLSFSVRDGTELPPSLKNIYKELNSDLGVPIPRTGDLTKWAQQGVLLLNASLTVRRGQADSHKGKGWEIFTDRVISLLNERPEPLVFILWGGKAKAKIPLITNKQHYIITSAHPSPLSASSGFFGSKPFSKCNAFLESRGIAPIDWSL